MRATGIKDILPFELSIETEKVSSAICNYISVLRRVTTTAAILGVRHETIPFIADVAKLCLYIARTF